MLIKGRRAERLQQHLESQDMWVPQMVVRESLSALARMDRTGEQPAATIAYAVAELAEVPLNWVDDQALIARAWDYRKFLQVSDAMYVAVAVEHGIPILTIDERLARAVREQVPSVAVITA